MIRRINIIGVGNLGFQIGKKAFENGIEVCGIMNRSLEKAQRLQKITGAKIVSQISNLPEADAVFLTLPDSQISTFAYQLIDFKGIVLHCSGATSMDSLSSCPKHGVFYPLQTFTMHQSPTWKEIPIFLETNLPELEDDLKQFAKNFSTKFTFCNSEERLKIHCGAVFVSNFVHALSHAAIEISGIHNFEEVYFPLIAEAVQKLAKITPKEALTGPAKRKDLQTLEKHISLIKDVKLKSIYQAISQYILEKM